MAYPPDPRNTAGQSAPGFANARLTLEDAERLAATFRPSWQPDEQTVSAQGEAFDPGLNARQGAATADLRSAVQALNGNYQPSSGTVQQAPDVSVIVDPAIMAPEAARAAPPLQTRTLVMSAAVEADPRLRGSTTHAATAVPFAASRASLDIGKGAFGRRSKMGLWMGLAAAFVAVVGVVLWLASGSEEKATAPTPPVLKTQSAVETRVATPPHALETPAAQPFLATPPPAQVPPPTAPAVAAPITAIPPPPIAIPVAPPPRLVVPPAPRQPTWTPPPAARPAARPKPAATTIVRDVPF